MRLRDIEEKIVAGQSLTSEETEHVVSKVEDYWNDHPDVTYRHPRWRKVMAWVAGYQYLDYNRIKKELMPVKLERTRKLVFNRLKPYVRTVLGKLNSTPPQTGVVPKTTEYEDEQAADLGDIVIEALSGPDKLNMAYVRKLFTLWVILVNRGALRVYWNEEGKGLKGYGRESIPNPDDPEQELLGEFTEIYEDGDIAIEAVSPFQCRPDPLYVDPKKWRWFLFGDRVDAEDLEERYGLEEGELRDEDETTYNNRYSLVQRGDQDFEIGNPEDKEEVIGRTVTFFEFWTPKIWIFVAGKKVLDWGPNPYGVIPYFTYEERLVPVEDYTKGITFNDSTLKDLIPVQREYNRWVSLISLGLERATKVKVMSPISALVNKKQMYDDGGITLIDYNRTFGEPHQLKLDPLPPFAMNFKQELEREMESGGNVHEASYGRLPERASHASGALVNLLVEQDDMVFDPQIRDIDNVFSQAWTLALRIIQSNYTTKRLLKVAGRDTIDAVIHFEGADLKGNTDVMVTSQVGLPKSRSLRAQFIANIRQMGLIEDNKLALELMEFGHVKKVFADQMLHEKKARRENMVIETNPMIDPNAIQTLFYDLDDDNAHVKIHMRDRLSAKFEQYTRNQKQALDMMIQWHQQRIQQAQQAQLQQQIQMITLEAQAKGAVKLQQKIAEAGAMQEQNVPQGSSSQEPAETEVPTEG